MSDSIIFKLRTKAIHHAKLAYAPYSHAHIGAALETVSGEIIGGCNIENSSYGGTVCAERVAIWKAMSENGATKIKRIYVYSKDGWPPCGLCRQVMSEFADENMEVIIGDEKGVEKIFKFTELLPLSFTPDYLLKK